MKILVAVDGSKCSGDTVRFVADGAWHEDDEFLILTVMRPLPREFDLLRSDYEADDSQETVVTKQLEGILDQAEKTISEKHPRNKVSKRLVRGQAARQISQTARDWGASLIIMGSHGRKGVRKMLLGSVAEEVLKIAHCAVQIVKGGEG